MSYKIEQRGAFFMDSRDATAAESISRKQEYLIYELFSFLLLCYQDEFAFCKNVLQKNMNIEHSAYYFSQHITPFKRLDLHRFTVGLRNKFKRNTFRLKMVCKYFLLKN